MALSLTADSSGLAQLSRKELEEYMAALEEQKRRIQRRYYYTLFPDDGPLRRDLYPKHVEFFAAGIDCRERCFMAANRVGKTVSGGFELTAHLTGEYPDWWEGRRFDRPIRAWAAGKTNETARDIVQMKLLGKITHADGPRKKPDGTGIIPGDLHGSCTWKQGITDFIDTIYVKHVPTGEWSLLGLKSYQQGRGSFEGTEQDVIWLDEEPPEDVYGECLIRTATTKGLIMLSFTPLEGMSSVVLSYMPQEIRPD